MKRKIGLFLILALLLTGGCSAEMPPETMNTSPSATETTKPSESLPQPGIKVKKVEHLRDEFILGADVSSLFALERSGTVFYGFDGQRQDLLKTLHEAGVNYIRVRVWNDPYDAEGNGYGGGNCDLENAIALGQRAADYGMGLLVDFHYSDFWADPAKQQTPKAWAGMNLEEKKQAIHDYTLSSLKQLRDAGVTVGMVQIGNETTGGFCGEFTAQGQYELMAVAAEAVRSVDPQILIAVHYTNPEKKNYAYYAEKLDAYHVDYDVFATSYYPFWHGTLENLTHQLRQIIDHYGKKVMVAETSWAYTGADTDDHRNSVGQSIAGEMPYAFSVQGQADALSAVIDAMAQLGEDALGVFYWEPAWIAVPGDSWEERLEKWEACGSGWASSYAGEYDPDDAGRYYGGSACDNQALFNADGHPLESLMTFTYVRTGT